MKKLTEMFHRKCMNLIQKDFEEREKNLKTIA